MLKRLIILNSEIYSKADIEIDDCQSLQIVGPNNIGKSTLIYALSFLFIIDGREMSFSGNRSGDKTTINHYFPTINLSFIIFEIFKNRFYSILIKRNAEGHLDYYKIDSDYKEHLFFIAADNGHRLLRFEEVLTNLSVNGIEYHKFPNRRDVFNFVYQKGKKNNAVVWLDQNVVQDRRGYSNNFSKIYKYLINSKLINNRTLKEALIIADNKENERVSFSRKNKRDIQTLLKHNRDIKVISSIRKSFTEFKEMVRQYEGMNSMLAELVFVFNAQYVRQSASLATSIREGKQEQQEKRNHLDDVLILQKDNANKHLGKLDVQIQRIQDDTSQKENLIREIRSYEGITFLEETYHTLDTRRKNIESQITQIDHQDLNSKMLEENLQKVESELAVLNRKIDQYTRLLIHSISDRQHQKELLHRILADDITSQLTTDHINSYVTQTGALMQLFDGRIRLPEDLKGKPIESVENLKEKTSRLEKEKEHIESLIPISRDQEKYQKELRDTVRQIKTVETKMEKIHQLPELDKELNSLNDSLREKKNEKAETEKEINKTRSEIGKTEEKLEKIQQEIQKQETRLRDIQNWKVEIEQMGIEPAESESGDTIENIYYHIKQIQEERKDIKYRKDSLFEKLKVKTETSYASEQDFIIFVDSELATIQDKEKAIDGLLKSISTQFSNPCRTIYSRFEEFKAFIVNRFNAKIGQIQISDIQSLKIEIIENDRLIRDLNMIRDIRDLKSELLFDDQTKNLEILNQYLDNQVTVQFDDLFDIRLHLYKKEQRKVVDLKHQIESDGTDKMIRLILIMSVINQIIINDEENKVVIFVDEIGTIDEANRFELLNFCKDNNFIPISAAPLHPYDGFDKYYLILRSEGKIVVSENNGNVIRRKHVEVV